MLTNNKTKKLVLAAILAALGMILNLIEITYPLAPWLNLDLSEVVVLIAVSMLGLPYAFFVCVCKFFISIAFKGPVGPIAIGQITALIASMSIAISYYGLSKVVKTKWPLVDYIITMTVTMLIFALVMFTVNYYFVTPTYLMNAPTWYTNLPYDVDIMAFNKQYGSDLSNLSISKFLSPYGQAIFTIYFPFNFIKGIISGVVYYFIRPQEKRYTF